MSTRGALFLLACFAGAALAAPDEEALGKSQGYPLGTAERFYEPRNIVANFSHTDKLVATRKIAKGAAPRPFKRLEKEFAGVDVDRYLSNHRTTGFLLLKGDTILIERYQYDRNPSHKLNVMSVGKTLVGSLVGIAIADGKIKSIDDRADAYVPELKGTPYGETPLRHLLTMSSGVRFAEDLSYSGRDDASRLSALSVRQQSEGGPATLAPFRERIRPPGERFSYASAETQVLGLVLRAATGKPVGEYLSEKIWQPMGAEEDATWVVDKGGYETVFCCFSAALRDLGRFGMLLANDGALDGRQIVPADWVRAATSFGPSHLAPSAAGPFGFGYGYQVWLMPGANRRAALLGFRGQAILIDPASKLVLVHTAVRELGDQGGRQLVALWEEILGKASN